MTHISSRKMKALVEGIGGKVTKIVVTKHAHVYYDYYGHECCTIFSVTPSSRKWEQYKYNDMKRDLKNRGIWRGK